MWRCGVNSRDEAGDTDGQDHTERSVRKLDPISLIAGVLTLLASAYILADGAGWVTVLDPRWVLAGAAVLAGVLMLGTSARRGRG